MKFQAEIPALRPALEYACKAVQRRNVIPVLGCVLIKADAGLSLFGYGSQIVSGGKCAASVSEPGAIAVDAFALMSLVRSSPKGGVADVRAENGVLYYDCGTISARLMGFPEGDFAKIVRPDCPHEVFGDILACAPSMDKGEARKFLRGVHLSGDLACATDGHRMSTAQIDYEGNEATIPAEALTVIGGMDSPRIFIGETAWRAEAEGRRAWGPLLSQSFPDFRRVIVDPEASVSVDAAALARAVSAATMGADTKLTIQIEAGGMSLACAHENLGGGSAVTVSVPCSEGLGELAINAKYLRDALAQFGDGAVEFAFEDGRTVVIRNGGSLKTQIMCMRHTPVQVAA